MKRPGPPLEVATVDGGRLNIQKLKGKVVLLDFMTTACPKCKEASAGIQKVYRELESKGFEAVAIALDAKSASALMPYKLQFGITFPIGTVSREAVYGYLEHSPVKLFYVPTMALLDRQGRIRSIETGWKGEAALKTAVLELLAESPRSR